MNRRGFLQGILLAAAAPAIVRADSLMRIVPRESAVLTLDMVDAVMPQIRATEEVMVLVAFERMEYGRRVTWLREVPLRTARERGCEIVRLDALQVMKRPV